MRSSLPVNQQRLKYLSVVALLLGVLLLAACEDTTGSGPEEVAGSSASTATVVSTPAPEVAVATAGATETTNTTADAEPTADQPAAAAEVEPSATTEVFPTAGTDTASTPEPAGNSPTPEPATDEEGTAELAHSENSGGGGGTNQVRVVNQADGTFRFRASTQLNRITGPQVAPRNIAYAYASCADCQTFAIALQINLISTSAEYVAPENLALAVNYECQRCHTVARAIQYTYSVEDPNQVPREVNQLLRELDRELRSIKQTKDITVEEAEARVNAVITQFRELAESLNDRRDTATEQSSPDATPEPETGEETGTPVATETVESSETVEPNQTVETTESVETSDETPTSTETGEPVATPEQDADATGTP